MYRLRKKVISYFQVFLSYFYKLCNSPFPKELGVWGVHSQFRFMLCLRQNLSSNWKKKQNMEIEKTSLDKAREALCHSPCQALFSGAAQLFLAVFYSPNRPRARLFCECEAVGVQQRHKGIPRDTHSPRGGDTEQHCQTLTGTLSEILYFIFSPISLDLLSRSI